MQAVMLDLYVFPDLPHECPRGETKRDCGKCGNGGKESAITAGGPQNIVESIEASVRATQQHQLQQDAAGRWSHS